MIFAAVLSLSGYSFQIIIKKNNTGKTETKLPDPSKILTGNGVKIVVFDENNKKRKTSIHERLRTKTEGLL